MLTLVETPRCPVCDRMGSVIVEDDDYGKWISGVFIQDAMPYLSAGEREMLLTGVHDECWEEMWGTSGSCGCCVEHCQQEWDCPKYTVTDDDLVLFMSWNT